MENQNQSSAQNNKVKEEEAINMLEKLEELVNQTDNFFLSTDVKKIKEFLKNLNQEIRNKDQTYNLKITKLTNILNEYKQKELEFKIRTEEAARREISIDWTTKKLEDKIRNYELEDELLQLEQNRDDWKTLYELAEIRVREQIGKVEIKEKELETAINAVAVQTERYEKARRDKCQLENDVINYRKEIKILTETNERQERTEKELKEKINEELLSDYWDKGWSLSEAIDNLIEKQKKEKEESSFGKSIADYTGITWLKKWIDDKTRIIYNMIIIFSALVALNLFLTYLIFCQMHYNQKIYLNIKIINNNI